MLHCWRACSPAALPQVQPVETGDRWRAGTRCRRRTAQCESSSGSRTRTGPASGAGRSDGTQRPGAVAQAHAEDMVRAGLLQPHQPRGRSPFDRLRAARVTYTAAAENIAFGYPTAAGVLDGWVASRATGAIWRTAATLTTGWGSRRGSGCKCSCGGERPRLPLRATRKPLHSSAMQGFSKERLATAYSPTPSRVQYHRRYRA